MTDKEKQIDEIARIIHFDYWGACGADNCSDCSHNVLNICNDKIIAEKLYNKLFPEGSVVMSEKEWRQIKNSLYYSKEELENKLQKARKEERKETAREFAEKLENGIDNLDIILHEDNDEQYVSINQLLKFIDELAKQFGVEVEE